MKIISDPWKHIIIDDFYNRTLFDNSRLEIIRYISSIRFDNRLRLDSNDDRFNILFPKTNEMLNTVDYEQFLPLFEEKRTCASTTVYHEISFIADGYEYPIHDENESKVLSIVTYLAPANGHGTLIYDQGKNFVGEIEWKQNRTLIFAGLTGKTWHSYKTEIGMPRLTINTFIKRNDLY